jgi:hypothetical protein
MLFEPTRRILDTPATALQSNRISSRCQLHRSDGAAIFQSLIEQFEMRHSLIDEFASPQIANTGLRSAVGTRGE